MDYRKDIMNILRQESPMVWGDLVDRFPGDAIDIDLPVAISYLREHDYIKWEEVQDAREWLVSFNKNLFSCLCGNWILDKPVLVKCNDGCLTRAGE